MARIGFEVCPRKRLRFSLLPALCALGLLWMGASPANAWPRSTDELDAQIQAVLDGVPAESADQVVTRILGTSPAATGYYGFSPAAFFQSGEPGNKLVLDTASGSLYFNETSKVCMYAPLHLPQGATVTGFVFWVRDNNSDKDADAAIRRRRLDGIGGFQELAAVSSSSSAGGSRIFTDFSISNGTIDNADYWYLAFVCLPGYTDAAGPTEMRGLYVAYTY